MNIQISMEQKNMNIEALSRMLYYSTGILAFFIFTPIMAHPLIRTLTAVNAEVACISGEASSPYAERVRLIHRLPSNLAPEQLERCRAFLESPLAGQPLPDLEFNGLKNELVFALIHIFTHIFSDSFCRFCFDVCFADNTTR